MPAKRALRLEGKEGGTPAKRPAPDRTYSPVTGTCSMSTRPSHGGSSHSTLLSAANFTSGKKTLNPTKLRKAQTDRLEFQILRSKIEGSLKAFYKARHQMEKTVPTEGSSELKSFFTTGSCDLQTELCKNRKLLAKMETCISGKEARKYHFPGFVKPASSYEYLKSLLN